MGRAPPSSRPRSHAAPPAGGAQPGPSRSASAHRVNPRHHFFPVVRGDCVLINVNERLELTGEGRRKKFLITTRLATRRCSSLQARQDQTTRQEFSLMAWQAASPRKPKPDALSGAAAPRCPHTAGRRGPRRPPAARGEKRAGLRESGVHSTPRPQGRVRPG